MMASQGLSLPLGPSPTPDGHAGAAFSPSHPGLRGSLSLSSVLAATRRPGGWGLRAGEVSPSLLLEVDVSEAGCPHSQPSWGPRPTPPLPGETTTSPPAMLPCPPLHHLLGVLNTRFLPGQPLPGLWQLTCIFISEERSVKEGLVWRKCLLFFPPL